MISRIILSSARSFNSAPGRFAFRLGGLARLRLFADAVLRVLRLAVMPLTQLQIVPNRDKHRNRGTGGHELQPSGCCRPWGYLRVDLGMTPVNRERGGKFACLQPNRAFEAELGPGAREVSRQCEGSPVPFRGDLFELSQGKL
jgi:hypothetical protein